MNRQPPSATSHRVIGLLRRRPALSLAVALAALLSSGAAVSAAAIYEPRTPGHHHHESSTAPNSRGGAQAARVGPEGAGSLGTRKKTPTPGNQSCSVNDQLVPR